MSVLKQKNDRLGWKCHVYKNTLAYSIKFEITQNNVSIKSQKKVSE